MRHVRLLRQASDISQSFAACSECVVPVMPKYMLIEAHCQGNRGINAVSRFKLNTKVTVGFSNYKGNEKFAHEYLTQTHMYCCLTNVSTA
jgi:hypothetical protein